MVEVADDLQCLFSGQIEEVDGEYVIRVPETELETGNLSRNTPYRIGVRAMGDSEAAGGAAGEAGDLDAQSGRSLAGAPSASAERESSGADSASGASVQTREQSPPVAEGDQFDVTIETTGKQGDGIAKVEEGYVVIVKGTKPGDEVTIEVTKVMPNFAIAEVVDDEAEQAVPVS